MAFGPKISEISKTTSVLGGYLVFAGLISYYFKERLYIPDPVLATIVGVIFGPLSANLVNPAAWFDHDPHTLLNFTLHFSRVVIGIQVFFNGANLPKKYIKTEWFSLFMVLGPLMTAGMLVVGLLIWGLIPGLSYLEALVIAACVTPTDPVLANSICKGRFAETFVPLSVRALIIGESGANDGLALPYLMLPLYLVLRTDPDSAWSSVGGAIGHWAYEVIVYQVTMGAVMGMLIGYAARKSLRFAHDRHLVDHESFLAYGVATAIFILGVVHAAGASDIIACFLAGCMINWDGWYQEESAGQAFGEIVDMYLATIIFLYIGALLPFDYWHTTANVVDGWRLVLLGITVLLLRRLPLMIPVTRLLPAMDGWKQTAFVGYFGPIGVGSLYWTQEALEWVPDTPNRAHLRNVLMPVSYFLILFSVLVHGLSIALFQGTRTAIGKGHPEPKEEAPIPIRPGADIYISPSHIGGQSRTDLSLSRTSTRRQSAREYLSRHISVPSQGPTRPAAYRSQLDLALERSNTRRTSAREYLDRARSVSPDAYDDALARDDSNEDPDLDSKTTSKETRSSTAIPAPVATRRRSSASSPADAPSNSSASLDDTPSISANDYANVPPRSKRGYTGDSASSSRLARLEWIRRGRLARGERVSDDERDDSADKHTHGDASDKV